MPLHRTLTLAFHKLYIGSQMSARTAPETAVAANASPLANGGKPTRGSNAAKRMNFTKAKLNELLQTRPHQQHTIWDEGSKHGLCVLVSRGPIHKRQGTVTFRVCYYLPSAPGKPRDFAIGRWPDG